MFTRRWFKLMASLKAQKLRVPTLPRYLQGIVDKEQKNGRFVLTCSYQLELRATVSRSLVGRAGLLHLLQLSIEELTQSGLTLDGFEDYVVHGFLPRVHSQNPRPFSNLR